MYFVRWYDPRRARPLVRDFHTKPLAQEFRDRLPFLAEVTPYRQKPKNWAAQRALTRAST